MEEPLQKLLSQYRFISIRFGLLIIVMTLAAIILLLSLLKTNEYSLLEGLWRFYFRKN
ncbi:hypothetical protein QE417_003381 [Mucilaginibacter terrae]|uniref:Uncharacterized protein n=1 Tax=Mucilaginibacter terrae TaxID=1955052 RepID=A0ABU3GX21_9SPHI|nr:hypothetical protein [Mucilaginibacter terrae]